MNTHQRMSPFTALFLGIFGVAAVGITAGGAIVLYGMRVADSRVRAPSTACPS
jgi:hypothetical protein